MGENLVLRLRRQKGAEGEAKVKREAQTRSLMGMGGIAKFGRG